MKWLLRLLALLVFWAAPAVPAQAQVTCTSSLGQTAVLSSFADNTSGLVFPRNIRDYVCSLTAGSILFTATTVTSGTSLTTLTTSGAATLNSLTVTNGTSLSALTATGASSLSSLTTTGVTSFNSLTVSGGTSLASLSTTSGNMSISALTISGATSAAALTTNNIGVTGNVNATSVYIANGTVGVSCAAGTTSAATLAVTNGIVTHC